MLRENPFKFKIYGRPFVVNTKFFKNNSNNLDFISVKGYTILTEKMVFQFVFNPFTAATSVIMLY